MLIGGAARSASANSGGRCLCTTGDDRARPRDDA